MTISELIKALESAEGPDRDLDLQIGLLLDGWTYGDVLPNFEWLEGFGTKYVKDHDGNVNSSHPGSMYTAYTESVDAAIALCERALPGWAWRVATCSVSDDAWVLPDFNSPIHGERLKQQLLEGEEVKAGSQWDSGFDVDQRPVKSVAMALCIAILRAKQALEDHDANASS